MPELRAYPHQTSIANIHCQMPLWFQAIQGVDAEQSGIRYLPLCAALIIAVLGSGWAVTKVGYFQPFMLLGSILVSVGGGLLSTLDLDSGPAKWISFQILAGLGIGASTQQPVVAVESLLDEADATIGIAVVLFLQNLGPSIMVSVANTIFANSLVADVKALLPGLDAQGIATAGATDLRNNVAPQDMNTLLNVYNRALTRTFLVAAIMAAGSILGLAGIGLKRIPSSDTGSKDKEEY